MLYMLLMLPLGIVYFTLAFTLLSTAFAFIAAPVAVVLDALGWIGFSSTVDVTGGPYSLPFVFVGGIVLLFGTLHLARGIGQLHGHLAKHLLVRAGGGQPA